MMAICLALLSVAAAIVGAECDRAKKLRLRVRLLEERRVQTETALSRLYDASRRGCAALVATLDEVVRKLDPAIDTLAIFVPECDELRCAQARGPRTSFLVGSALSRANSGKLPALAGRKGQRAYYSCAEQAVLPNDRDAVAVPLRDRDELLAVVYASSSRTPLTQRDGVVSLLEYASPAYAVARERERDRRAARFDGLTGLLTPRAFRDELHAHIACARLKEGTHATIWFVDTDEFKRINDTLGHAAGDVVLQGMAKLLHDHAVPAHDVAARNGGDEFLLLLRDTPKSRAIERAQAFCRAVRQHDFGVGRSISASVGVAAYPLDARSSSGLLELADAAMYHSKRSGRGHASFVNSAGQFTACGE